MATGDESPPVIARPGEIGFGLRDFSQLIEFAEAAGQSIDPSGFGDYEQAKQTLDSRLGVSIDDDLIGRLRGDMAGSVSLEGEFGLRAEVENPAAFEKTLAKVAKVLPASPAATASSAWAERRRPGVTGVVDGVFVVASDPQRAREIASRLPRRSMGRSAGGSLGRPGARQRAHQAARSRWRGGIRCPALHRTARGPHGLDVSGHRRSARARAVSRRVDRPTRAAAPGGRSARRRRTSRPPRPRSADVRRRSSRCCRLGDATGWPAATVIEPRRRCMKT